MLVLLVGCESANGRNGVIEKASEVETYRNEYLNISFEYPNEWGNASENINGESASINFKNGFSISYTNQPYAGRGGALEDMATQVTKSNLDNFCENEERMFLNSYESCEYLTNNNVKFVKAHGKWNLFDSDLEQTVYMTVSPSRNYQGLFIGDRGIDPKEVEDLVMSIDFINDLEAASEKIERVFDPETNSRIYSLDNFPFKLQFPASWLLIEKDSTYEVAMENNYQAVITFEKSPSTKELHELTKEGWTVFDNKNNDVTTFCGEENSSIKCIISSNKFGKELYAFSIKPLPTTEEDFEWIELVKYNIELK